MNDYYLSFEISPHNEGEPWRPLDALEVAETTAYYFQTAKDIGARMAAVCIEEWPDWICAANDFRVTLHAPSGECLRSCTLKGKDLFLRQRNQPKQGRGVPCVSV